MVGQVAAVIELELPIALEDSVLLQLNELQWPHRESTVCPSSKRLHRSVDPSLKLLWVAHRPRT